MQYNPCDGAIGVADLSPISAQTEWLRGHALVLRVVVYLMSKEELEEDMRVMMTSRCKSRYVLCFHGSLVRYLRLILIYYCRTWKADSEKDEGGKKP